MPRTAPRPPLAAAGGGRPFFNRTLYEVSGTFLMPVRTVWVTGTGGGGGGGDNGGVGGLGGGSGQTIWRRPVTLAIGTSVTITVGAGGVAGTAGGDGADGSDSTFGSSVTAVKGGGGSGSGGAAGVGGTSSNSAAAKNIITDIVLLANEVSWGTAISGLPASSQPGAGSFWSLAAGNTPPGYGAGGLGKNITPAEAGRAGVIIVEW